MPIQAINELKQNHVVTAGPFPPTLDFYFVRLQESFFKLKIQVESLDRVHFNLTGSYLLKDDEPALAVGTGNRPPYLELFSQLAARYELLANDLQTVLDELNRHL